jgi:hypothetical protein
VSSWVFISNSTHQTIYDELLFIFYSRLANCNDHKTKFLDFETVDYFICLPINYILVTLFIFTMATYDPNLPATATKNIIATHLGDFDVPTSRKAHKLGDLLTCNVNAVAAFTTANTNFIRLNDEQNLAQARFDAATLAFDTVTTTWITTRLERDNACIALAPAQARYELDRKHALEHIVLQLFNTRIIFSRSPVHQGFLASSQSLCSCSLLSSHWYRKR